MKKWKNAFWNLLLIRLMILLEFEPGDAMQTGYFQYLDEIRGRLSESRDEAVQTEKEPVPVRPVGRMAGYGTP